jgi:hypothetical protein
MEPGNKKGAGLDMSDDTTDCNLTGNNVISSFNVGAFAVIARGCVGIHRAIGDIGKGLVAVGNRRVTVPAP